MAAYSVAEDAYLTVLLHAAKYPSCSVNGVLLGRKADGKGWTVSAAVPLFHHSQALAPCVETALAQVQAFAKQQNLQLVGIYHSDKRFTATDLSPVAKRMADRLADHTPSAFALFLDNQRLQAFCAAAEGSSQAQAPVDLFVREGGSAGGSGAAARAQWRRVTGAASEMGSTGGTSLRVEGTGGWEALRKRFLNVYAARLHQRLCDFDEHLDDLSCDYTNEGLLGPSTQLLVR